MMTSTWLRSVVAPLSVDPPPSLLAIFRSCEPDPTGAILARAERVLTSIFPTSAVSGAEARGAGDALSMGSVLDPQWARVRREESSKLYWRALGNILAGEARQGRGGNAGALLGQDLFHRCLLALCSELVLASHKSTLMAFPAVLKPARVTPFDLIKVIETLVRAEDSLPRELKRHLNSIEEKILESLAWDRVSAPMDPHRCSRECNGAAAGLPANGLCFFSWNPIALSLLSSTLPLTP
jgi:retinoblastoma-like protein 1